MKLTLISHLLCPYVQRAVIALTEKQVAYERIDIDLRNKPQWFLALSPLGKTPVLKVDQEAIFESAVICEYLDDTISPRLHPEDPLQRARHRAWIEAASATLSGIWSFYTAKDEDSYQAAAAALAQRFGQLEQVLGEGPYFSGAQFSLVDAAFAPVFRYFDVFDPVSGVDVLAGCDKVKAWRATLSARQSVQQAVRADYPALLRQFVIGQRGVLGRKFEVTAELVGAQT